MCFTGWYIVAQVSMCIAFLANCTAAVILFLEKFKYPGTFTNTSSIVVTLAGESFQFHFKRPPTMFREGNVFSQVCLSFCSHEREGVPLQGPSHQASAAPPPVQALLWSRYIDSSTMLQPLEFNRTLYDKI